MSESGIQKHPEIDGDDDKLSVAGGGKSSLLEDGFSSDSEVEEVPPKRKDVWKTPKNPVKNDEFVNTRRRNQQNNIPEFVGTSNQQQIGGGNMTAEDLRNWELQLLRREVAVLRSEVGDGRQNQVTRRPDTLEMANLVRQFDPDGRSCPSSTEFVEMIEAAAVTYDWDDYAKFYCACFNIKGPAEIW